MKSTLVLLLSTLSCVVACFGQSGDEMLKKYQATIKPINTISYNVQRIDTFGDNSVWDHFGRGILQRSEESKILGARFLVSRPDLSVSYHYNGNVGFKLHNKAKTFKLDNAPYAPSVLGSASGQMLVEELLAVDPSYQTVAYDDKPQDPVLILHYPDQPSVDVLNRYTYLVLDRATGLPKMVKTVVQRGGGRWTTIKILSNLRINNSADVDTLNSNIFLTKYAPVASSAPKAKSGLMGQTAPDFQLTSFTKSSTKLSNYRGKVVLLDFWATSCSPCIAAMPKVQRLQELYKGQKLVVLGILMDPNSIGRARGILQRQKANYINLVGSEAVETAYQIKAFPRYLIVGKNGKIIFDESGYSEQLEAAVKSAISK